MKPAQPIVREPDLKIGTPTDRSPAPPTTAEPDAAADVPPVGRGPAEAAELEAALQVWGGEGGNPGTDYPKAE